MKSDIKNNNDNFKRFLDYLVMEKKKTVMALSLIVVMAFMWAKVLGVKGPKTVHAEKKTLESIRVDSAADLNMSYVELPKINGRNDVLSRDFFVADEEDFRNDGKMNVFSIDGSQAIAKLIAGKLRLEAIELGTSRQAFINDKLLSAGDKLIVSEGTKTYECKIVGIEENTVFIECQDTEITLKLVQKIEGAD